MFKVNLDRIKARFVEKKKRGVAELELDERSIDTFVLTYFDRYPDARWNGRQIRNACQTALALAEFEAQKRANPGVDDGRTVMDLAANSKKMIKVKMTAKHFTDVARAYLAFMKYLKEVHGGASAAQRAKEYRLRNDRWEMPVRPRATSAATAATAAPAVSGALLASRRAAFAEKKAAAAAAAAAASAAVAGKGKVHAPKAKPVAGKRVVKQQFHLEVEEVDHEGVFGEEFGVEGEEDELGEFGGGEDDMFGQFGQEDVEDPMFEDEEEDGLEEEVLEGEDLEEAALMEDFGLEEEEDPLENEEEGAELEALEDENGGEEEAGFVYEEPVATPPPSRGRVLGAKGRGLPRVRGTAVSPRGSGVVRAKAGAASLGPAKRYSPTEAAPRTTTASPAPARVRGQGNAVRGGRGRRGARRLEG